MCRIDTAGLTKRQLRNILLGKLRKQTEQQREFKSRLIEKKLLEQEEFIKAEKIMFYLAIDGEVKTESMIDKARSLGKQIYVPLCDREDKTLKPCVLEEDSVLREGPYHTLEPQGMSNLAVEELDLIIVPALAFDRSGNRLGRGKGYYDRFLRGISPHTHSIGLAFDFQVLPALPVEQNDMPVDKVISA